MHMRYDQLAYRLCRSLLCNKAPGLYFRLAIRMYTGQTIYVAKEISYSRQYFIYYLNPPPTGKVPESPNSLYMTSGSPQDLYI